ncbi:OmpA family protein [Marinobacter sp.]|uniref:OmpA family protein n=1 Tax=Marinobacter sp. TaxID=50741 RepID=UPI00384B3661
MNRSNLALAVALGSTVLVSGCATMDQHGGKILGAVSGAAIGALACDGEPTCIAAGLIGGLVLGDLYDKRQEKLRKLAQERGISLESQQVKTFNSSKKNALEMAINDGGMFKVGSDKLKTKAKQDLMAIASVYRGDNPQKLLVIGHSDASGSDAFNQTLSESRARTVARLFEEVGVPSDQIYFQGAGESQPIATNDTKTGRSANRRVEIVEIDSEKSLAAYNLQRQNDSKYLAHSNRTASEKDAIRKRVKDTPKPEPIVAEQTKKAKPAPAVKALVDFGGKPASSDFSQIAQATGDTNTDSGGISFSLFSEAVAGGPAELSPCYMDAPRVTGSIQNLATGQKLNVADLDMSDYWPGLNGNVWHDTVNGHMVAYQDLRVMRASGSPEGRPTVRVYEDIGNDKTADFVAQPHIESYPGQSGLLLRTYFTPEDPMECMDVVMPNTGSKTAKAGVLYYAQGEGIYEQNVTLQRLR